MKLENIVPWGRNFAEYKAMFSLSDDDLKKKILGCGDGPACFNAEMTALGHNVTSVDPIYGFSAAEIRKRIDETYENVLSQVKEDPTPYRWTNFRNPDDMASVRMRAMNVFLEDYEQGRIGNRYIKGELPVLDFPDKSFDLCLSSHFLFLYSNTLSLDFHIKSITEMLRVAPELRIFPLFNLTNTLSEYVNPVRDYFQKLDCRVELLKVPYEFQRGADTMMKLTGKSSI